MKNIPPKTKDVNSFDTFIPMLPMGKERPRFGNGRTYTPTKTVRAENRIQEQVGYEFRHAPMEGPLMLTVTVYLQKPKTAKCIRPTVKPDADNYAKLVCDALNGLVWHDDAQVCRLFIEKLYCSELHPKPGFRVVVHAMDEAA